MKCFHCGKELPDGQIFCTNCNRLSENPEKLKKEETERIAIIFATVLLSVGLVIGMFFLGPSNPKLLIAAFIASMSLAKARKRK